jgi:Ion channel
VDETPVEKRIEKRLVARGLVDVEGDGLYDRYLLALALLILTIITFAWAGNSDLGRLTAVAIEGLTLLVILRSSRVHKRFVVAAAVLVAVCLVGAAVLTTSEGDLESGPVVLGALLALIGPPVIIRHLLGHLRIDLTTIAGALCVYLLAGLLFAFVYGVIGDVDDVPFFVQEPSASAVDYVYFSFVTLATLGYGDLTARGDLGRMLAVTEAVAGQLYLVSAVALLVGNLGRQRGARRDE